MLNSISVSISVEMEVEVEMEFVEVESESEVEVGSESASQIEVEIEDSHELTKIPRKRYWVEQTLRVVERKSRWRKGQETTASWMEAEVDTEDLVRCIELLKVLSLVSLFVELDRKCSRNLSADTGDIEGEVKSTDERSWDRRELEGRIIRVPRILLWLSYSLYNSCNCDYDRLLGKLWQNGELALLERSRGTRTRSGRAETRNGR